MFLTIFFSSYALLIRKKTSVAFFLAILVVSSSVSGLLINNVPVIEDFKSIFNLVFIALILFVIVHSFKDYSLKGIRRPFVSKTKKYILLIVSLISLLVLIGNIFIVYKSFYYVFSNDINITSYKNEGEAALLIRQWVPPLLVTFVNIFSSLGYVALGFHFYFLINRKIGMSLFYLLISMNIPLNGLHGMSRSASVEFILIYIYYCFYIYGALDREIRLKVKYCSISVVSILLIGFYYITDARFTNSSYYSIEHSSIIQNKSLFSIFDYFSQWCVNGLEVIDQFSFDKLMYGKSFSILIDSILNVVGFETVSYTELRYATLDLKASAFNGLVATLVYDFSHLCAFLFSLTFFLVVRSLGPRDGIIPLGNFILFGVLIAVPVMFFGNNQLSTVMLQMGVLYSVITCFIIRVKF